MSDVETETFYHLIKISAHFDFDVTNTSKKLECLSLWIISSSSNICEQLDQADVHLLFF